MYIAIKDLISEKISGEWGEEGTKLDGVKIIRTANFTNNGTIDYSNIVYRKIDVDKIELKQLQLGDIIIEKSGGSPTQPVGRVVFFNNDSEKYLCNNFTAILRPDRNKVYPKYLFYQLFINHLRGRTQKYQNKTTGIINLRLDDYLNDYIYVYENIEDQIRSTNALSNIDKLLYQRQDSINLLDKLLTSKFFDLFGDPTKDRNKWTYNPLGQFIKNIIPGSSYGGEDKGKLDENELGVLKVSAVTSGTFNHKEFKAVRKSLIKKKIVQPKKGDLLFSRANTRELVGATCIVDRDYDQLFLPDKIWKIELDEKSFRKEFIHFLLRDKNFKYTLSNKATGSSGSMLNISMSKLRELECPMPPIALQNEFSEIVEKANEVRFQYLNSLDELRQYYNMFCQLFYKGELNVTRIYSDEIALEINNERLNANKIASADNRKGNEISKKVEKGKPRIKPKALLKTKEKINWDNLAAETIANWIKEEYSGYHFNNEMLHVFLLGEHVSTINYFSSEELKKNPTLTSKYDIKKFLYDALNGDTPFIKLQQHFYDAVALNFSIILTDRDNLLIKDRTTDEKSGIYFSIENL